MKSGRSTERGARLSRSAWEDAALSAIAEGGAASVSVEGLARALGVTKGSFYWHFVDRAALLESALARWEEAYTERVIRELEEIEDPRERLRVLFRATNVEGAAWRVHVGLHASVDEPVIARALARVSKRRIGYVERCYRKLGLGASKARSRALVAYAAYLGFLHLRREAPSELPRGEDREDYLRELLERFVSK